MYRCSKHHKPVVTSLYRGQPWRSQALSRCRETTDIIGPPIPSGFFRQCKELGLKKSLYNIDSLDHLSNVVTCDRVPCYSPDRQHILTVSQYTCWPTTEIFRGVDWIRVTVNRKQPKHYAWLEHSEKPQIRICPTPNDSFNVPPNPTSRPVTKNMYLSASNR